MNILQRDFLSEIRFHQFIFLDRLKNCSAAPRRKKLTENKFFPPVPPKPGADSLLLNQSSTLAPEARKKKRAQVSMPTPPSPAALYVLTGEHLARPPSARNTPRAKICRNPGRNPCYTAKAKPAVAGEVW